MEYSNLIKELLQKRGFETEAEMDEFLHPSFASFHNPFLLSGMTEAVERINRNPDKDYIFEVDDRDFVYKKNIYI